MCLKLHVHLKMHDLSTAFLLCTVAAFLFLFFFVLFFFILFFFYLL